MRSASQNLSVNELDSYGYTPLQCACANKEGDERIIARLLEVPGGATYMHTLPLLTGGIVLAVDVATPIKSDNNTALHYFCQYDTPSSSPPPFSFLLLVFTRPFNADTTNLLSMRMNSSKCS